MPRSPWSDNRRQQYKRRHTHGDPSAPGVNDSFERYSAEDVASATFTVTKDLDAEFPALAARQLGWLGVPLLCGYELSVPGSLPKCVRILLHWNTAKAADDITHVYIKDAVRLRPDLSNLPPVDWNDLENWIEENLDLAIQTSRKTGE